MKITSEAAREWGRIGGLRRTESLTLEERRAIAIKASKAAAKVRREKAAARNKVAQRAWAKAKAEK